MAGPCASSTPEDSPGATATLERQEQQAVVGAWVTLVWNDPVNLMSYVSYVFRSYFGYGKAEADRLMMQVHTEGRAVVSSGPREKMETDVAAMHEYGLWATLQRDE